MTRSPTNSPTFSILRSPGVETRPPAHSAFSEPLYIAQIRVLPRPPSNPYIRQKNAASGGQAAPGTAQSPA